jgi:hypothetical protein
MRVSPLAMPPKRTDRCEIDLSPGMATLPLSEDDRRAVSGRFAAWIVIGDVDVPGRFWGVAASRAM